MALSPDDPRPLFEQVAAALREQVTSGVLAPGARIPSTEALRAEFGVARNTARHAVGALVAEGLLVARHGSGVFVRAGQAAPAVPELGEVLAEVRALRDAVEVLLRRLGG